MMHKNAAIIGTVASILFASAAASADDTAAAPAPAFKTAPPPGGGDTDHDGVVSHLGVTVFPTQAIPFPGVAAGITAPVVGVRYWLMPKLGLDGGLGIGWLTGSAPSPFAMAFHVGVPLALASSQHFTFIVSPEANLAFAHENIPVPAMANNTADGFLFDMGARVGAEIQFGFIGIPQLALQGTVGLLFTHTETNTNVPGGGATHANNLTTTVQGSPWAIFTNAIQATYYL
jgi:hypothetical protein